MLGRTVESLFCSSPWNLQPEVYCTLPVLLLWEPEGRSGRLALPPLLRPRQSFLVCFVSSPIRTSCAWHPCRKTLEFSWLRKTENRSFAANARFSGQTFHSGVRLGSFGLCSTGFRCNFSFFPALVDRSSSKKWWLWHQCLPEAFLTLPLPLALQNRIKKRPRSWKTSTLCP